MTRPRKRRDQIENMIESALQPGRFVGWNEGSSFVSDLSSVEAETAKVTASEPARAVALYETFLAACYAKLMRSTTRMERSGHLQAASIKAGLQRGKRPTRIPARPSACC
jgi:hypothetical protein